MILAKALKQKNRLAQRISKLQEEIQVENSSRVDDPKKINVEDSLAELESTTEKLIKIKIAIFVASTPVRENILRLGELKSKIVFLKGISTIEGKIRHYERGDVEYSVAKDKIWVKNQITICEQSIDCLQDELDTFNHTTNIEI
jgi:hypothetical protein